MRQVNDFAVAAEDNDTCQRVIQAIDKELMIKIKDLGEFTRYNGVDIMQTQDYIKLETKHTLIK